MTIQTQNPNSRRRGERPDLATPIAEIEVDPLADIIAGTGTLSTSHRPPGGLRSPLWRLITTSDFGHRVHPVLGTMRFHRGIDYGARTGTPIRTAATGTVVWSNDLGPYGTLVVVAHAGDVHTAYGHLHSTTVHVGQHVRTGQQIGRVGTTGLSTGPHLHFEVRDHGSPVSPHPWLTECSSVWVRAFDAIASKLLATGPRA